MHTTKTHGPRNTITVALEKFKSRIAPDGEVHLRARHKIMKISGRNLVLLDRVMEGRQYTASLILPPKRAFQSGTPCFRSFALILDGSIAIGNVVGATHECVESTQRIAFRSAATGLRCSL